MKKELKQILVDLADGDDDVILEAIRKCASLFERDAAPAKDRHFYDRILGDDFKEIKLTSDERSALVSELARIAEACGPNAGGACFAIGKTFAADYVPVLKRIANMCGRDDVSYQALIGIENCGIDVSWDFIAEASKNSEQPKTRAHAAMLLDLWEKD